MRVRVKRYESVMYDGVWYNQGDELEVKDLGNLKDKVEVLDPPEKTKKEEE
jgi:hypothetical protein